MLEYFSTVSQETQQKHSLFAVLPTEEEDAVPSLKDVELERGTQAQ